MLAIALNIYDCYTQNQQREMQQKCLDEQARET